MESRIVDSRSIVTLTIDGEALKCATQLILTGYRRLGMGEIIQSIKQFLAPGIDESKNAEIHVLSRRDGSFHVDEKSFRESDVVKQQIRSLRKAEKERA